RRRRWPPSGGRSRARRPRRRWRRGRARARRAWRKGSAIPTSSGARGPRPPAPSPPRPPPPRGRWGGRGRRRPGPRWGRGGAGGRTPPPADEIYVRVQVGASVVEKVEVLEPTAPVALRRCLEKGLRAVPVPPDSKPARVVVTVRMR